MLDFTDYIINSRDEFIALDIKFDYNYYLVICDEENQSLWLTDEITNTKIIININLISDICNALIGMLFQRQEEELFEMYNREYFNDQEYDPEAFYNNRIENIERFFDGSVLNDYLMVYYTAKTCKFNPEQNQLYIECIAKMTLDFGWRVGTLDEKFKIVPYNDQVERNYENSSKTRKPYILNQQALSGFYHNLYKLSHYDRQDDFTKRFIDDVTKTDPIEVFRSLTHDGGLYNKTGGLHLPKTINGKYTRESEKYKIDDVCFREPYNVSYYLLYVDPMIEKGSEKYDEVQESINKLYYVFREQRINYLFNKYSGLRTNDICFKDAISYRLQSRSQAINHLYFLKQEAIENPNHKYHELMKTVTLKDIFNVVDDFIQTYVARLEFKIVNRHNVSFDLDLMRKNKEFNKEVLKGDYETLHDFWLWVYGDYEIDYDRFEHYFDNLFNVNASYLEEDYSDDFRRMYYFNPKELHEHEVKFCLQHKFRKDILSYENMSRIFEICLQLWNPDNFSYVTNDETYNKDYEFGYKLLEDYEDRMNFYYDPSEYVLHHGPLDNDYYYYSGYTEDKSRRCLKVIREHFYYRPEDKPWFKKNQTFFNFYKYCCDHDLHYTFIVVSHALVNEVEVDFYIRKSTDQEYIKQRRAKVGSSMFQKVYGEYMVNKFKSIGLSTERMIDNDFTNEQKKYFQVAAYYTYKVIIEKYDKDWYIRPIIEKNNGLITNWHISSGFAKS